MHLGLGGTVVDQANGLITGNSAGIMIAGAAGTVSTAGTIAGSGTAGVAFVFAPGYANLLIDKPGAKFIGTVDGGNPPSSPSISSTLELASGVGVGTLSGIGSQFVDFARITVDAGAAWTLAGSNTIAYGVTLTDGGSLTNTGTLTGAADAVTLASGASLTNAASGTVTGASSAVLSTQGSAANSVANYGSIAGAASPGIMLSEGGTLINAVGGTISGANAAVYIGYGVGVVTNAGRIAGASFFGVAISGGGSSATLPVAPSLALMKPSMPEDTPPP